MGVNLSIKDVPDDVAERLRQRAARNHRSLQGELMAIVEQAAREGVAAAALRQPSVARMTVLVMIVLYCYYRYTLECPLKTIQL